MGPLLANVLSRIDRGEALMGAAAEMALVAAHVGGSDDGGSLPVIVQQRVQRPAEGETWPEFKERANKALVPLARVLGEEKVRLLPLASAVAGSLPIAAARGLAEQDDLDLDLVELDPLYRATLMDDAILDVDAAGFRSRHGALTGRGVRVAVLDSGVDLAHPFLNVADSVSTCGESVDIPGSHGTHCAGSIASRDSVFQGVAPDVTLINIKVLQSDGRGQHGNIVSGIGQALDRQADILSMSIGFNHLPAWSDRGHGWHCPDGRCPMCLAVDNAVSLGAVVVVAAGNEHDRAQALRAAGFGKTFDTEIACPGQAAQAITVGALTKTTFLPAGFSSHGPTAFKSAKPDISGPGVNVMSTVPVPRSANGAAMPGPARADLFDRKSGTSMATPIVAGCAALLVQMRRQAGLDSSPAAIRAALLASAGPLPHPSTVVGDGRVRLP